MSSAPLLPTAGPRNPTAVFPAHNPTAQFSFPKQEVDVLEYWKDIDAFAESLRQSEGKPEYTFYDGQFIAFRSRFSALADCDPPPLCIDPYRSSIRYR